MTARQRIFILAALACAATAGAAEKYDIHGRVNGLGPNHRALVKVTQGAERSAVTNETGVLLISGLNPGTYLLTPSHQDYHFTPESKTVTITTHDVNAVVFTAHKNPTPKFTLSGSVSGLAPNHLATLKTTGHALRTTTSHAGGSYSFTNLEAGTYTVRPTHPGYHFNPTFHTVAITNHDVTDIHFTASPDPSTKKK